MSPRMRFATSSSTIDPIDAVVDLEKGLAPGAPLIHEHLGSNLAAHVVQRKGDYGIGEEGSRRHRQAQVSLRSRRFGGNRESRGGGRLEREVRRDDDLGHDAGAHPDTERTGGDAWPARIAGQRDRAVCRRRFRAEDHDVLSRRAAAAMGGDAAEPAAEVDRRSPGEFLRDDAGARPGARRGDGADERRPHPRCARRLSVRHWRVRSVRADDSDQQPVHAAGPVRHSQLRERVHGGLHQQDDRDAGAGARDGSTACS